MSLNAISGSYKKGLILGLTLAETIILVIFCILLLFTVISKKKNLEIQALKSQVSNIATYSLIYQQISDMHFRENLSTNFKKLSLAKSIQKDIRLLQKSKNEEIMLQACSSMNKKSIDLKNLSQQASLEEYTKNLLNKNLNSSKIENALLKIDPNLTDLQKQMGFLAELKKISTSSTSTTPIIQIVKEFEKYKREVANSKGQIIHLKEQLAKVGNGLELPPCWADINTGKPEYIFDIALSSNGFVLHDKKLPHRTQDQAELPIDNIEFDKSISQDDYLRVTKDLYQWSLENECRFFVKVYDKTGSSEKALYKKLIRILEMRFYKFESNEEFFTSLESHATTN